MFFDVNNELTPAQIIASVGQQADAAAASDTATASLIALIKRLLQTETGISGKLPTLVGGNMPVSIVSGGGVVDAGTVTASTAAMSSTSANIITANANRKRLIFGNPASSSVDVWFAFTGTATASGLLVLKPGKGWIEAFNNIHRGIVTGITASGTATVNVLEWV